MARGEVLVASGEADDHRTALDRAEEQAAPAAGEGLGRPRALARPRRPTDG